MTDDDALHVQILSGEGGMQNELKITDGEDLQVAVEQLELAARYQFGEAFTAYFDPNTEDLEEELDDLRKLIEDLNNIDGKRFDEIEDRLDKLRDFLGKGFSEFQEMKEKIEDLPEASAVVSENEESTGESPAEDESEEQDESKPAEKVHETGEDEEDDEEPDLGSKTIPEIVEEQLVEVESPPYSYDEFKDFSYTEQQAAIYAQLLRIQPATKEEVTDAMIEGEPENAEVQYIYQRLDDMSAHIDKRKRPSDSPRDPFEYAEAGFDFEDGSDQAEQDEDTEEGEEAQRELDLDKSQVTDDSQDDTDGSDSKEEPEEGAYGFEWMSIDEAVEKYKEDKSTKYLLCIRSMKSYTSTMMAEKHAEEGEGEVWAVTEELPDDFLQ